MSFFVVAMKLCKIYKCKKDIAKMIDNLIKNRIPKVDFDAIMDYNVLYDK